jgi:curved DNA-binding protein CbpA
MSDPFLTLGIDPDADDHVVESAYRAAIKRCPPDRDPAGFQAVRAAYERVRTQRDRIAYALFETEPPEPIDILRRAEAQGRRDDEARPRRPDPTLFAALLRGED